MTRKVTYNVSGSELEKVKAFIDDLRNIPQPVDGQPLLVTPKIDFSDESDCCGDTDDLLPLPQMF